jgi:chemotaxis protein methyltransferase CheR
VLPDLFEKRAATRRLRVWSAGCSTGEEAYTVAILAHELLSPPSGWQIDVIASDLNQRSLAVAQRGVYSHWSFRDTPDDIRERYFRRVGDRWKVTDEIAAAVRFIPANLAQTPLLADEIVRAPFDLILCRNVTIYFSPTAQTRLYAELCRLLAPDGWLVLGPSDPPPDPGGAREPRFFPGAILWQLRGQVAHRDRTTMPGQPGDGARSIRTGPVSARPAQAPAQRRAPAPRPEPRSPTPPLDAEPYLATGLRLLDEGHLEEAIASLRRSAYLDPDNPLAHFMMGRAYQQLREQARAISATRQALRLLATMSDDDALPVGDVSVGELRLASQAQLLVLSEDGASDR